MSEDPMPSRWTIVEYWASSPDRGRFARRLLDVGEPCCFACGWYREGWDEPKTASARWNKTGLERAHIVPNSLGGASMPDNLVLLCKPCHIDSPDWPDPSEMARFIADRKTRNSDEWELVEAWQRAADEVPELIVLSEVTEQRALDLLKQSVELAGLHWGEGITHGTRVAVLRNAAKLAGASSVPAEAAA